MPKKLPAKIEKLHHKLGGSTSARWLYCTASPEAILAAKLAGIIPKETSSIYAEEGTAAHELLELCLKKKLDAEDYFMHKINGFVVDEEMISAVQIAIDYVKLVTKNYKKRYKVYLERRFDLTDYVGDDCGGSSDITIIDTLTGASWILDYKHGKGVIVDVEGNTQLRLYALGIYRDLIEKVVKSPLNKPMRLGIIQPRASHIDGPIRIEKIKGHDIKEWGEKTLIPAVKEINSDRAKFMATLKGCEWCPLKGTCVEHAKLNVQVLQSEFEEFAETDEGQLALPAANTLTQEEAEHIILHKKQITKWLDSVEELLHLSMESGSVKSDNFKLVLRTGHRKYSKRQRFIKRKLKKIGLTDESLFMTAPDLLSPAQLEKSVAAHTDMTLKQAKEFMNELTEKPELGYAVSRMTDGRQEIPSIAQDDFKDIDKHETKKPRKKRKIK